MNIEAEVSGHYTTGRVERAILNGLSAAGKDLSHLNIDDFGGDEFHVGGVESTKELAAQMHLVPGMRTLDVGCGIGGPARYFAAKFSCRVDGVDLTQEFVEVANSLSRLVKLDQLAVFQQGSGLNLPFQAATFDAAYMIHVGMNIADKAGVYREIRRVTKPGALLVLFDLLRVGEGPLTYPLPWALSEQTSFVADAPAYRAALSEAGFEVTAERNRGAFGIASTEQIGARMASTGPPALGLHLLMGEKTPAMLKNVLSMMKQGVIAPMELFARAS